MLLVMMVLMTMKQVFGLVEEGGFSLIMAVATILVLVRIA